MSHPKKRKKPPDLSLPWPPSIDSALAVALSLPPCLCSACSLSICEFHLQNLVLFSAFGFVDPRFLKNWGYAESVGCVFWMEFLPAGWPETSTLSDGVAYDGMREHEQMHRALCLLGLLICRVLLSRTRPAAMELFQTQVWCPDSCCRDMKGPDRPYSMNYGHR